MKKKPRNNRANPEKQPQAPELTPQQALYAELSKVPVVPVRLERTLTPAFTKEYFRIMTSKELVEMDWLHFSGELNFEEALQYTDLSGTYAHVIQRVNDLTKRMDAYFNKAKLLEMVKQDMKGKEKEGIRNMFQQIENLVNYTPEIHSGKFSAYNHLCIAFRRQLMAYIGRALIEISVTCKDVKTRDYITEFIEFADRFSRSRDGFEFSGIMLYNELVFYGNTFRNPDNQKDLDAMIGTRAVGAEEKAGLEEKAKKLLQEILKEASYKKILLHRVRPAGPQVLFFADDFIVEEGARYTGFCAFRINFNKHTSIGYPKIEKDPRGNTTYDFENITGVVNCTLNPVTGDLSIIVNKAIDLSAVLSPERYLLLKVYLMEQLRDYLVNKEPDIEDLFAPSVQERRKETGDELKKTAHLEETAEQPELKSEPAPEPVSEAESVSSAETPAGWQYQPYAKPAKAEPAPEPEPQPVPRETIHDLKVLPKGKRKAVMDKIWSATGAQSMSAIKRLLKEPVRQAGSHVFFRSDRTNATLPVPNSVNIPPPLIIANLKGWGISLMEYARELGVKL